MEHQVFAQPLRELSANDREGMFRLRYDTFKVRLGWDVQTTEDGLEIDQFDGEHSNYILARSPGDDIDACWRLLPTLGPNMLRDVFPQLLAGQPAPAAADVWELSRFALATDRLAAAEQAGNYQLSFGPLSVKLMAEAARFAKAHGIVRYVTVTTAAIERMLKKQGLHIHRLGPPVKIGNVLTLACFIEVDDMTLNAVGVQGG
jgi:acyl homoserine lactone synthase